VHRFEALAGGTAQVIEEVALYLVTHHAELVGAAAEVEGVKVDRITSANKFEDKVEAAVASGFDFAEQENIKLQLLG
jgi:hypothetical protein